MQLSDLVKAVIERDALTARQWVADSMRSRMEWSAVEAPQGATALEQVVAAALVELLASRAGQPVPEWTSAIGEAETDIYLVRAARTMPRLRRLCESEAPEPLRRRRLYAPPDFLTVA